MTDKTCIEKLIIIAIVIILFGLLCGALLKPYFKMQAFNQLSDKKITYWYATFLDLSVVAK